MEQTDKFYRLKWSDENKTGVDIEPTPNHLMGADPSVSLIDPELERVSREVSAMAVPGDRDVLTLGTYLSGQYFMYRVIENENGIDSVNLPGAQAFTHFLAAYGQSSGNIWDFDADGVVGSSDLTRVLSSWGQPPLSVDYLDIESLSSIVVMGQFSSGWIIEIIGWEASFLKVTPSDEGGLFFPETLNSFFIEGYVGGGVSSFVKLYFHKY